MSPASTHIRRAQAEDCDELTRVAHAAKRFWGYDEQLILLWRADLTLTPALVEELEVYCAVDETRIVGFYALSGEGDERELEHMWVDPQQMGAGVGRALFEHLLAHLRQSGATRLNIESDPNAEGFYRRMGAERIGESPSTPAGRFLPVLEIDLRRRPRA